MARGPLVVALAALLALAAAAGAPKKEADIVYYEVQPRVAAAAFWRARAADWACVRCAGAA
jgi:hypothetical protein